MADVACLTVADERAPLAALCDAVPPRPQWPEDNLACEPEVLELQSAGTPVEVLAWGKRGDPGILLLHGAAAHAGIWRLIAPFLAKDRRVVAFSWPGMGGSGWRDSYSLQDYSDDLMNVANASGIFNAAQIPVIIGHSAGGGVAIVSVARHGEKFAGFVLVDSGLRSPIDDRQFLTPLRPRRTYPTLTEALAHFRYAPIEPAGLLTITDMIAGESLHQVEGGWCWRFDPGIWGRLKLPEIWDLVAVPKCSVGVVNGEHSKVTAGLLDKLLGQLPDGSPHAVIPGRTPSIDSRPAHCAHIGFAQISLAVAMKRATAKPLLPIP